MVENESAQNTLVGSELLGSGPGYCMIYDQLSSNFCAMAGWRSCQESKYVISILEHLVSKTLSTEPTYYCGRVSVQP